MKNTCCVLIAVLMISSCASGSYILTGQKRDPIDATLVKLYTEPPQQYEVIAIVNASSDSGWTQQGDMDYAVAEIKEQAAKLGANGIILIGTGETSSTAVKTYRSGAIHTVSSTAQTVSGKAIYVTKE